MFTKGDAHTFLMSNSQLADIYAKASLSDADGSYLDHIKAALRDHYPVQMVNKEPKTQGTPTSQGPSEPLAAYYLRFMAAF